MAELFPPKTRRSPGRSAARLEMGAVLGCLEHDPPDGDGVADGKLGRAQLEAHPRFAGAERRRSTGHLGSRPRAVHARGFRLGDRRRGHQQQRAAGHYGGQRCSFHGAAQVEVTRVGARERIPFPHELPSYLDKHRDSMIRVSGTRNSLARHAPCLYASTSPASKDSEHPEPKPSGPSLTTPKQLVRRGPTRRSPCPAGTGGPASRAMIILK
jgi:hypothetical protein